MESEWLREAISLHLKASITQESGRSGPHGDPRRERLEKGLLLSKRLILTYHLVILSFVFVVSVSNWIGKAIHWKRLRNSRLRGTFTADASVRKSYGTTGGSPVSTSPGSSQDTKAVFSSNCSTFDGTTIPPSKIDDGKHHDDESPLLHHCQQKHQSFWKTLVSRCRSFWMYQPPPIPVVNKVLPANGTSFLVLVFIALNLFYTFYLINFNIMEIFVFADRCGLMFVANLPILYLLAAKTQPLKFLTGRSYESVNIFHRRVGELLCLDALLHSAGMFGAWYFMFRPIGFGLLRFLLYKTIFLGIFALVAYELIFFTSLASFRARWYELFLLSHVFLQIAALVLLYFHHHGTRTYVLMAASIFILDRLMFRLGSKSITVQAEAKILEDEETVRLTATIPRHYNYWISILGHSLKSGWNATDHVFLTIPSLSASHILQTHPFTIASQAPAPDNQYPRLSLLIRAQNGFSRDLLNAARLHKQLTIRLDGPYGSSHARDMLSSSDVSILIAGGSGIAVCWPLVYHLTSFPQFQTDPESALHPKYKRKNNRTIILIWIIHESTHLSWIGRPALQDAEYRGVEIIVPRATEEIGRPDLRGMVRDLVDLHAAGVEGKGEREKRVCVVSSGPDGMARLVRNTCAEMVGEGRNVGVVVEKFGW